LPAFEVALDLGVDTLELDLHFTKDDEVVVWHDPSVIASKCRLAEPNSLLPDPNDPFVEDTTLMIRALDAAELAGYSCNRNPDTDRFGEQTDAPTELAGPDFHIATLDEVFAFVKVYAAAPDKTEAQLRTAAAVRFNVETKRDPNEPQNIGDGFDGTNAGPFELAVLEVIAAHGFEDRVTIQSFDHRSLWAIHAVAPHINLSALTSRGSVDFRELAEMGAAVWSPNQNLVSKPTLEQAHAAGLRVIPWTVNDPDEMESLIDLGVDGIITDRPDVLMSLLGR
jgi:glycerophosphoryl diester phosphodiesterase